MRNASINSIAAVQLQFLLHGIKVFRKIKLKLFIIHSIYAYTEKIGVAAIEL